jgi:Uma2 family endonuclease
MTTLLTTDADAAQQERPSRRPATIEEFWALPESVLPTEYVNGEIIMAPAPAVIHQMLIGDIYFRLREFLAADKSGECFVAPLDVVLPTGDVVQPDVFFLPAEEAGKAKGAKRVRGVPPLVVEVLSPGSVRHDTLTKRALYERNGVAEYWIVDPDTRTLAQLTLRGGHYAVAELGAADTLKGEALPGFEIKVSDLLGAA